MNTKIVIAAIVVALVAAFFAFDLQQYFSLQTLKEQKDALNQLYRDNPVTIALGYFLIYVAATALALPAAAILTLASMAYGLLVSELNVRDDMCGIGRFREPHTVFSKFCLCVALPNA